MIARTIARALGMSGPSLDVHFSPRGGCTARIVQAIDAAAHEVLVQAYNFSSPAITDALNRAAKRGLRVSVVIDRVAASEKSCTVSQLAGCEKRYDAAHRIAHNKVIIIDDRMVLTGSFNFTDTAEAINAENLLVITDARIAALYAANWQAHYQHSLVRLPALSAEFGYVPTELEDG